MGTPYMDASLIGRRGQPGRPTAGMSATKRICQPGYQAGRNLHSSARTPSIHPRRPRLVPVQGRGRAGSSTSARRARCAAGSASYFQDPVHLHPRTAADGGARRLGRVDRRRERRRGDHARVQPDQGAPAPLQHPPRRRQELPLPGGHRRRRVAEGDRHARRQAQGHPLLRALRPRLCDPRDARPAAPVVPDPDLLRRQAPAPPAPRTALPAVPHRAVLGPLRRGGGPRGVREARRTS